MQTRTIPARHPRATAEAHFARVAARAHRRDVARRIVCGATTLLALLTGISMLAAHPAATELFDALTLDPRVRGGIGAGVALLGFGLLARATARYAAATLAVVAGAGAALHVAWGLTNAAAFLAILLAFALASFGLTRTPR